MRLQLSEHIEEPGDIVFKHACTLGYEATREAAMAAFAKRMIKRHLDGKLVDLDLYQAGDGS
jgi:hypothetical protein